MAQDPRIGIAMAVASARQDLVEGRIEEARQSLDLALTWLGIDPAQLRRKIERARPPCLVSAGSSAAAEGERVH